MKIYEYNTLVFDCDGVILNSNSIKTQAFYKAALPYGKQAAQDLVNYHVTHGGISRYKKFEYFLKHLSEKPHFDENELKSLLEVYAQEAWYGLLSCEVTEGLKELRDKTASSRWLVVSGGDQSELRQLFEKRSLHHLFDGGIFGSPDTKEQILNREFRTDNIQHPAIFFGDTKYDYETAAKAGLEFVFVSDWSEFSDWPNYFSDKKVLIVEKLSEILNNASVNIRS